MDYAVIPASALTGAHLARWREIQLADAELASPFYCPEFTAAVAAVRHDVWVAVLTEGGEIAGFFPFQRGRSRLGRPVGGPLSDYHGLICERAAQPDLHALLRACSLDAWDFDHLSAGQSWFEPYVRGASESHVMDLAGGYDGYVNATRAAGSKVVKRNEKCIRQMTRERGEPVFTHQSTDLAVLHRLFELKSAQYRQTGITDVLSFAWTRQLLEHIMAQSSDSFSGMLSYLSVGGRLAAIHMGMRSHEIWHWWFPVHTAKFADYSPGVMLCFDAARQSSGLGVRLIDFGKDETPFKLRLRTGTVPLYEGSVERTSIITLARSAWRGMEAWVRRSCFFRIARYPGHAIATLERRSRFR